MKSRVTKFAFMSDMLQVIADSFYVVLLIVLAWCKGCQTVGYQIIATLTFHEFKLFLFSFLTRLLLYVTLASMRH